MIQGSVYGGQPTLISGVKGGTTSWLVPTGQLWHILWLHLKYVADANVASRYPYITVTLVNTDSMNLAAGTVTAGQTKYVTYGLQSGEITVGADNSDYGTGKLITLYPGHTLTVTVTGAQAGDTWSLEGLLFKQPFGRG